MYCWAGCGQTGTMLTAYLLYKNRNMTVDEAVKETKKRSPIPLRPLRPNVKQRH